MHFEEFVKTLDKQELISLVKYRKNDLNNEQLIFVNKFFKEKEISFDIYSQLLKEKKIKRKENTCKRCFSEKIDLYNEKRISFSEFYVLYLLLPWELRINYTCHVCGFYFKRWISFKILKKLFIKSYMKR